MKTLGRASVLVLVLLLGRASFAAAGEKDVLKALEKIKANLEAEVPYDKCAESLVDAKAEINMLKREVRKNQCFMKAVHQSYSWFKKGINDLGQMEQYQAQAWKHSRRRWAGNRRLAKKYENLAKSARQGLPEKWDKAAYYLDEAYGCLE